MANKIVFYIRALFHQSLMPGNEKSKKPDVPKLVACFNKFSRISAQEYRQRVHAIQLENLRTISDRFIYNEQEHNPNRKFNYAYSVLQPNALKLLAALNDDDIVIPFDDDDWLSPDILKQDFQPDAFNYWDTASFTWHKEKFGVFYNFKTKPLPVVLETEADQFESRGLLSNCQSAPGWYIKHLLAHNKIDVLQRLLQRHNQMRGLIREKHVDGWEAKENIFDKVLSVYVRHAANVTLFQRFFEFGNEHALDQAAFDKTVEPFRQSKHTVDELPVELKWASPYLKKLEELNQLL